MKEFFKKLIYNGNTKEPSLTALLVIVFAMIAGYGAINEFVNAGAEPNAAVDLFWGALAAYTGRRMNIGNKTYSGEEK